MRNCVEHAELNHSKLMHLSSITMAYVIGYIFTSEL